MELWRYQNNQQNTWSVHKIGDYMTLTMKTGFPYLDHVHLHLINVHPVHAHLINVHTSDFPQHAVENGYIYMYIYMNLKWLLSLYSSQVGFA